MSRAPVIVTALAALCFLSCAPADDPSESDAPGVTDAAAPDDAAAEVAAPDVEPAEDLATLDLPEEAEAPAQPLPWANVFLADPDENGGKTSMVQLEHITAADGALTGEFANVSNCLKEAGGAVVSLDTGGFPVTVHVCHEVQTVFPDEHGNYIKVKPPKNIKDGNDKFAEVMAYYHVDAMHDYFRDVHGHEAVDVSLYAIVNFEVSLMGAGWMPIDNAAYLPEGSLDELGVDLKYDDDLIVMGQGQYLDYSYDGDVIRHEYTHFSVGADRLLGYAYDELGFDDAPLSINEALADFFTSSVYGDPVLGAYSLGGSARNLEEFRRCPDHYLGEVHYDGQIVSSALWRLRGMIGAEWTERLAYGALTECGATTNFDEFADALYDQAGNVYAASAPPGTLDAVRKVMELHGVDGCRRVIPADAPSTKKRTLLIPGSWSLGMEQFSKYVPAPLQLELADRGRQGTVVLQAKVQATGLSDLLGPPEEPNVWLAVRAGQPVSYTYEPKAKMQRDMLVKPAKLGGSTFRWTIPARSLPAGTLYLQLVNFTGIDVAVTGLDLL